MSRQVLSKEEATSKLVKGINILCNAVAPTLGPKGKCAILNVFGPDGIRVINVTKDGISVAEQVEDSDVVVNTAIQIVKQASRKLNELGDGTTTVTVLAREILAYALELKYEERVIFFKEISKAIELLIKELKKNAKKVTLKNIGEIAAVSANNDQFVGELFEKAYKAVGLNGYINVVNSKTENSYVENIIGYAADMGLVDNRYANDKSTNSFKALKAYILLYNKEFTSDEEFRELLKDASTSDCPIVIIAKDFSIEIQARAAALNGKIALVRNQLRNEENQAILDDIKSITDADIVTRYDFTSTQFGIANNIELKKGYIVFYDVDQTESNHVKQLKIAMSKSESEAEKEFLQKRITRLTKGLVTMFIGAKTNLETDELKDRINDAIGATKNSIQMGYILGGGQTTMKLMNNVLKNGNYLFVNEINKIIQKPFKQMLLNADFQESKIEEKIKYLLENDDYYNVKTECTVHQNAFKIYDPLVIVISTLETALSVATTFAQTETLIVQNND